MPIKARPRSVYNEPVMQEANTNNDTPVVADMVCVVDINATY